MRAPLPDDEAERLVALRGYRILDSPSELAFDEIAELACIICQTSIAAISLVDEHRQWFKSSVGLGVPEMTREVAFCAHAILTPEEIFEIPDATRDARFVDNDLVLQDPFLRFYAGAPLVDANGAALGTVCVAGREPRVLTSEQKKALRALSRQAMALLRLHRMLFESEQQAVDLRVANETAKAAARAKDNFLAGIGHELRTPLNGVVGLTSLLIPETLTDAQCETVMNIDRSAKALVRVVDDLLDYSELEDPLGEVRRLPFQPSEIVDEVADLYVPEARRRGLSIVRRNRTQATYLGDGAALRRILIRLLDNAVKFTETGGVQIELVERRLTDTEGILRIDMVDTGIGFPEGERPPAFAAFELGHMRHWGGAGLGLNAATKLVEKLGGTSGRAKPEKGGTRMWFEIPVGVEPKAASPIHLHHDRSYSGFCALVAEDNRVNSIVTVSMLKWLGLDVITAENGVLSLAAADRYEFDIVFMDLQMPEMDGIEATRRLRGSGRSMPIVALTASSTETDRLACREAGMDGYLVKPLREDSLAKELAKFLPFSPPKRTSTSWTQSCG